MLKINDTKLEEFDGTNYCIYCGNKAKEKEHYDEQGWLDYIIYYCDCDGVLAEHEYNLECYQIRLKYANRMRLTKKIDEMRYEKELSELKRKYNK